MDNKTNNQHTKLNNIFVEKNPFDYADVMQPCNINLKDEVFYNVIPSNFNFNEDEYLEVLPNNFKFHDEDLFEDMTLGRSCLFKPEKTEIMRNTFPFIDRFFNIEGTNLYSESKERKKSDISEYCPPKQNEETLSENDKLVTRLNYIENDLLEKSIMPENSSSHLKSNFSVNLKLAEKYLTGSIVSLMNAIGKPLSFDEIKESILPKFDSLRKSNGSKYNTNFDKALNSTLISGKIFFKPNNEWFYREKEALDYILQITEKEMNTAFNKSIDDKKSRMINKKDASISGNLSSTANTYSASKEFSIKNSNYDRKMSNSNNIISNPPNNIFVVNKNEEIVNKDLNLPLFNGKKKRLDKKSADKVKNSFFKKINTQLLQVYKLLDEYLLKVNDSNDTRENKEIFRSIRNKGDFNFLKEIEDMNSIAGVITCLKFFKSLSKFIV